MDLTKLPRSGVWEVALLQAPGGPAPTQLIVADVSARRIRNTTPISEPGEISNAVLQAAASPDEVPPGRPETIRCIAALRAVVLPAAQELGASVQVADHLHVVDQVVDDLLARFLPAP